MKIAMITGGTKGIGKACTLQLAKDGYFVLINFAHDKQAAADTLKEVEATGGNGLLLPADLSDMKQVDFTFRYIEENYNKLDVLVNCAGIVKDSSIFNLQPRKDFDNIINLNMKATLACIHYASKLMFQQKFGSIINISSVSATFGNPGQILYSSTKGAVNSMTITAAKELAAFGIRVNAIAPGFIETDMLKTIPDIKLKKYLSKIPLGTIGSVDDIANAVSFLADDKSKYITGQIITVDGGLSL